MPSEDCLSDDYVANLLAKDPKDSTIKYSALGLHTPLPKRPITQAAKPNTRFLRNIIRETDTHNAALKAKELEDARARLKRLRGEKQPRRQRNGARNGSHGEREIIPEPQIKQRRLGGELERYNPRARREEEELKTKSRARSDELRDTHHKSHFTSRNRSHYKSEEEGSDLDRASHRHRHHHHHHRHRSRSRSRQRTHGNRSRSPSCSRDTNHRKSHRRRHRSPLVEREPKPSFNGRRPKSTYQDQEPPLPITEASGTDSDPLEAIIGPLPALPAARPRPRGRGAITSSAMDLHFSASYDPNTDIRSNSDSENDWDQALEALKDRQRWKQQGADRLRAAGFTEDEVGRWEKGGEKGVEDVRWRGSGEGREWDRGKVVGFGDDGALDVETGPEWGRLKGT